MYTILVNNNNDVIATKKENILQLRKFLKPALLLKNAGIIMIS